MLPRDFSHPVQEVLRAFEQLRQKQAPLQFPSVGVGNVRDGSRLASRRAQRRAAIQRDEEASPVVRTDKVNKRKARVICMGPPQGKRRAVADGGRGGRRR